VRVRLDRKATSISLLVVLGVRQDGQKALLAIKQMGGESVDNGWRVLFMRASDLVQRLQVARRELALESAHAKLDKYHLLILDDIAYISKDQAETSALFELIWQPLRAALNADHRQSAVRRMEQSIPRPGHDTRRHRPPRPPRQRHFVWI
jgi:hypothetical protein